MSSHLKGTDFINGGYPLLDTHTRTTGWQVGAQLPAVASRTEESTQGTRLCGPESRPSLARGKSLKALASKRHLLRQN